MQFPFTKAEFLDVFRSYNAAIGVAPLLLAAMAILLVALVGVRAPWRHRLIGVGLAMLWMWAGLVYHIAFFARINPAARAFGGAFVLQGLLLLVFVFRDRLRFARPSGAAGAAGWVLFVYALVMYPALGWLAGHGYPGGPSFGAPCPVTIYYFAMMLWVAGRIPIALVVVPMVWALLGTSAALQLGIVEDLALPASALIVVVELIRRRRHAETPAVA